MPKIFFFILFSLFGNSLEITSISQEEKEILRGVDPLNFQKKALDNNYFIGKTGKYHYSEMEKYGRYIEENFSKSKIYFKKYKDYLEFKKFKKFLFPKLYIETDRKNPEIEIVGEPNFRQGNRIKRDKKYKIILKSDDEKIEEEIFFTGQKIVLNFGNRIEIENIENKNQEFMFETEPRFLGNWEEAKRYCQRFEGDNYSDWRLPTLLELWHVKNRETDKNNPRFPKRDFWSGDRVENYAWGVDLNTGSDKIFDIKENKRVFCVRGISDYQSVKLENSGDEVFTDSKNGFMWSVQNRKESWKDSRILCLNSEKEGFEDWRLPTIRELYSIRESEIEGRFWSGTSFFENYRKAWGLNFDTRKDTWDSKTEAKRDVICVRKYK
ncbi:Protein of unknown function (DUF1566) [Thiovulum sp. ES]|nr:Protein of unknown function (DUF1566) [Thiovulum sp. ES]